LFASPLTERMTGKPETQIAERILDVSEAVSTTFLAAFS
jgi:hypothetical protein